jgi:hypothetical protein
MAPFRGINKHADPEDVSQSTFIDGENLVCTEKPGAVLSRSGYTHWKVDENGFGVVFPQPIAILPGGGSVDGIITPPIALPVSDNPSVVIPIGEDPPLVPEDGPKIPISTPEDPIGDPPEPPPPPPPPGAIVLSAIPNAGIVDTGEDFTVDFQITEDLPEGVTIASYEWDFQLVPSGFVVDTSGASLTATHDYSVSDFSVYDNQFLAAVKGTGSDTIIYTADAPVRVIDLTKENTEGYIKISAPNLDALPSAEDFTVTVQNFEKNATTDKFELKTTDADVLLTQVAGVGTLKDTGGADLPTDFPGKHIPFTASNEGSGVVQIALEGEEPIGVITLHAVQEGTGRVAERTWGAAAAQMLVEFVDADGNAITEDFWAGTDTESVDPSMYWEFYAKLTAKDTLGATDTSFNGTVSIDITFSLPGDGYGNEWDGTVLSANVLGRDYFAVYDPLTADTGTIGINGIIVDADFFSSATTGQLGQASIKIKVWKDLTGYDYTSELQDANSGVGDTKITATVTGEAAAYYASTEDSIDVKGAHWINLVITGDATSETALPTTATLLDVDANTITEYDDFFILSALDADGNVIQVSSDGVLYGDDADLSVTAGVFSDDIYLSIPSEANGPISVATQVAPASPINGYQPIGVDEVSTVVELAIGAENEFDTGAAENTRLVTSCRLNDAQVIVVYTVDHSRSLATSGMFAAVMTVDGNSVSIGEPVQLTNTSQATPDSRRVSVRKMSDTYAVISYVVRGGGGNNSSVASVISITGTSLTVGERYTFETNASYETFSVNVTTLSETKALVIYASAGSEDDTLVRVINRAGMELAFSASYIVASTDITIGADIIALDSAHAVAVYHSGTSSSNETLRARGMLINGNVITFGSIQEYTGITNIEISSNDQSSGGPMLVKVSDSKLVTYFRDWDESETDCVEITLSGVEVTIDTPTDMNVDYGNKSAMVGITDDYSMILSSSARLIKNTAGVFSQTDSASLGFTSSTYVSAEQLGSSTALALASNSTDTIYAVVVSMVTG